jgi:hypothetical protein
MLKLTEDEYKYHINNISNDEVAKVLFDVLTKIHKVIDSIEIDNDDLIYKTGIFKVFFKQYNTVLSLIKGTRYVYLEDSQYLDIKSINILTRSLHETYLLYTFLCFSGTFPEFDKEEEINFKSLSYKYSGECDNAKTFHLIKSIKHDEDNFQGAEKESQARKVELWQLIEKTKIYESLSTSMKAELKRGNWKVCPTKKLSWADLADYSHLSKDFGKFEYHNMSLYAHSTFSSLQLEANHNNDVHGLMFHCYVIVSVFSISTLKVLNKTIFDDNLLSKRELSLILEFQGMSQQKNA